MAHDSLYGSLSSWNGTLVLPARGPDTRDLRDPEQLGLRLLSLKKRFKRPFHAVHDFLEEARS